MGKPSAFTAKWEPALLAKRPTTLIASPLFKNCMPFRPTYEKEKHVWMNWLMGWEYSRIWFEEQKSWEMRNFGQDQKTVETILRKRVQRVQCKKQKLI